MNRFAMIMVALIVLAGCAPAAVAPSPAKSLPTATAISVPIKATEATATSVQVKSTPTQAPLAPTAIPAKPSPVPPTPTLRPPTVTPIPLKPSPPAEPTFRVTASVSNPSPRQSSQMTVAGQLTRDGQGVAGAAMRAIWHYRTTSPTCEGGPTGADGKASCSRNIGGATSGFTVRIEVIFEYQGRTYKGETSFTPQ